MTDRSPTRRRLLLATGGALLAGLAGCAGLAAEDDSPTNETSTTAETTTATPSTTATTTSAPITPHDVGAVHYHGTMVLEINGVTYHFGDRPKYAEERTGNEKFHFHTDGKRDRWHVHAEDVTIAYAANTMPDFDVTAHSVSFEGHTYSGDEPGTSVAVTVNGTEVDPATYVFEPGDEVVVIVKTDRATPTTRAPSTTTGNGTAGNESS